MVRRVARLLMVGLAVVIVLTLVGALGTKAPFRSVAGADPTMAAPTTTAHPVGASPPGTQAATTTHTTTHVAEAGSATAESTPTGPAIVHVGFYVNDIQDIDLQRHRYQIDFYLWFRWTDPNIDPSKSFEFMNGAEQWGMTRTPASDGPVVLEDGSFYFREHIQSMFKQNMPLEDYPYDTQDLKIIIEDVDATSEELVYVADDPAAVNAPDLTVPGYQVHEPTVSITDWFYSELGEKGAGNATASRIEMTISLTRPWLPYTLKIFVPLLLVVLCASLVFFIGPKHVDARFGLGISSLLTLIALKWTTDGEMPLMDYLGLIDALYVVAFVYVALGLADTTYTTWKRGKGIDDATLERTDRRIFVGALVFIVVSTLFVITTHVIR